MVLEISNLDTLCAYVYEYRISILMFDLISHMFDNLKDILIFKKQVWNIAVVVFLSEARKLGRRSCVSYV